MGVPLQGYVNLGSWSTNTLADPNRSDMWLAKLTPRARLEIRANRSAAGSMQAHLTLSSDYRIPYRLEFSENFVSWTSLGMVTNTTGSVELLDAPSNGRNIRYYRARDRR